MSHFLFDIYIHSLSISLLIPTVTAGSFPKATESVTPENWQVYMFLIFVPTGSHSPSSYFPSETSQEKNTRLIR